LQDHEAQDYRERYRVSSCIFQAVLSNTLNTVFYYRIGRAARFHPARTARKHCKGEIRMNGNLKKITAALLALVFLLALLPAEAAAATSGSCGANLRWTLDSSGVLTISGTGDMTNFSLGVAVVLHARSNQDGYYQKRRDGHRQPGFL
jgi:hypothetical protein